MNPNYKLFIALKAIIVKDGKVLIVRESKTYKDGTNVGKWGVPGGRMKPEEHFYDALTREVKEETGLNIQIGSPVHIDEWFPVVGEEQWHIVATFIICTPETGSVILSDEHDEFAWITPDEVQNYTMMPEDIKAILAYKQKL